MGSIRLYKCSCGYEKKLFIGCGMGGKNLKIIKNSVPDDVYADFLKKKESGQVMDFLLGNAVISCPDCAELGTVSDFSYETGENTIRYTAGCPICGKKYPPLEDEEHINCPKCNEEMTFLIDGFWD